MSNPRKFDDLTPKQQAECLLAGSVIMASFEAKYDAGFYAQWDALASRYTDDNGVVSLAIDIFDTVMLRVMGSG